MNVKEACEKWGKEHGICVTPSQLIEQLQVVNKKLNLILYHRENGLSHPELNNEILQSKLAETEAENKQYGEALEKYGRHLRSCELSKQPKFTSTDTRWKCTCGLSIAIGCDLCGSTGYLVCKEGIYKGGFFYTGHCVRCGRI